MRGTRCGWDAGLDARARGTASFTAPAAARMPGVVTVAAAVMAAADHGAALPAADAVPGRWLAPVAPAPGRALPARRTCVPAVLGRAAVAVPGRALAAVPGRRPGDPAGTLEVYMWCEGGGMVMMLECGAGG